MSKEKRYWESSVIIAYLNNERGRSNTCQAILDAAERGEIQIFTSALTIAEVLKYRGSMPITKDKRDKVAQFFQNDYIKIVTVDRWLAFDAQELVWENGIPPKDAIHVASALRAKVDLMETYDDDDLIKKSGTVGSPPLTIREPSFVQLGLFNIKEENESEEKPSEDEQEE